MAISAIQNGVCIRVGEGTVAPLHEKKLQEHEVKTVGVIEIDPSKKENILKRGLLWFESYEEALKQKPAFWDICVPHEDHLPVMKKIIQLDPQARILVEKPVCMSHQIPELLELLKNFKGKIVVNENYLNSEVTQSVKKIAFDTLHMTPHRIVVEMDKNRTADFLRGRYTDPEGAFKYEGPHMLTILQAVLDQLKIELPQTPHLISYEPLHLPNKTLNHQGSAHFNFRVRELSIELFSSMNGKIQNHYPPYTRDSISENETGLRYRILAIEGKLPDQRPCTVVGFFEPIESHARCIGKVVTLIDGKLEKTETVTDDSMGQHLGRAADYLIGKTTCNPCPVEKGIEIVKILDRMLPKD